MWMCPNPDQAMGRRTKDVPPLSVLTSPEADPVSAPAAVTHVQSHLTPRVVGTAPGLCATEAAHVGRRRCSLLLRLEKEINTRDRAGSSSARSALSMRFVLRAQVRRSSTPIYSCVECGDIRTGTLTWRSTTFSFSTITSTSRSTTSTAARPASAARRCSQARCRQEAEHHFGTRPREGSGPLPRTIRNSLSAPVCGQLGVSPRRWGRPYDRSP